MKRFRLAIACLAAIALLAGCSGSAKDPAPADNKPAPAAEAKTPTPANPELILATTTSTQDSGLLEVMIPMFEKKTGYKVKTVAVGTGAALKLGEEGNADVMLVHAPSSEKPLVAKGVAINRKLVMHNDFIIVGPAADPAKIKGTKSAAEALKKINDAKATFISRGDESGTHTKEKSLWTNANIKPAGDWYVSAGQGMGATLKIADEKQGYTLTDRATYLAQQKNFKLEIMVEGDAPLLNIYHVMQVNPEKFPKVNKDGAKAFSDFFLSQEGQDTIKKFGVDKYGQPLFFPDGGKQESDLTGK